MKTKINRELLVFVFLILILVLSSAAMIDWIPTEAHPNHISWYIPGLIALLTMGEYFIYKKFLKKIIPTGTFLLSHFIIYNILGLALTGQETSFNFEEMFFILATFSVTIFGLFLKVESIC